MTAAENLALWILSRAPECDAGPITHLKLQKLLFYVYGAALAFEHEADVGPITFEPWKHGPVVREIWTKYQSYARDPIPAGHRPDDYPAGTEKDLRDALAVYGALDAWSLRQESHLEAPWIDAFEAGCTEISNDELRTHFRAKYRGAVQFPRQYLLTTNLTIDGLPEHSYPTFSDLADAVKSTRSQARQSGWPISAL